MSSVSTEAILERAHAGRGGLGFVWILLVFALVGAGALRGRAAEDLTTVAVLPREEFRDVVVNLGGARAAEVRYLIDLCRETVLRETGHELVPEIGFVGEF